jgi:hypothetical protein
MKKQTKQAQLAALQTELNSLEKEINDRGASPEMEGIPGGRTGLLKVTSVTVGTGENARTVQNVSFDAESVAKLRSTLERARELTTRPKRGTRKGS